MAEGDCQIELLQPRLALPSHWHIVEIDNRSAEVIGREGERVTAVRKKVGLGEVIWIPSPIGRAAYEGDRLPLAQLMQTVTASFAGQLPFKFNAYQPSCLMRVMRSGKDFITVLTNDGKDSRTVSFDRPKGVEPSVLWGQASHRAADKAEVTLAPKETMGVTWRAAR